MPDLIPDADHILRHVKATAFDDGKVLGAAFEWMPKRPNDGASVNWIERAEGDGREAKIDYIRHRRRLTWKKSHRLAILKAGQVRSTLQLHLSALGIDMHPDIVTDPLNAEGDKPADPTHALIEGIPHGDTPEAEAIRDCLAAAVLETVAALAD